MRRGNADERGTGRAIAHDVGPGGTNSAGDSATLRTRLAVVVNRHPGHFGTHGGHAGPGSAQRHLGATRHSRRTRLLAATLLRIDFADSALQYLPGRTKSHFEQHPTLTD